MGSGGPSVKKKTKGNYQMKIQTRMLEETYFENTNLTFRAVMGSLRLPLHFTCAFATALQFSSVNVIRKFYFFGHVPRICKTCSNMQNKSHPNDGIEKNTIQQPIKWQWNSFDSLIVEICFIIPVEYAQRVATPGPKPYQPLCDNGQSNSSQTIYFTHF